MTPKEPKKDNVSDFEFVFGKRPEMTWFLFSGYYRVDFHGLACVGKYNMFLRIFKLDIGISCKRNEITVNNKLYGRVWLSHDLRNSCYNKFYTF